MSKEKLTKEEITLISKEHNFDVKFIQHYVGRGYDTQFFINNGCKIVTNQNGFYSKEQVLDTLQSALDMIDKKPIISKVLTEKV